MESEVHNTYKGEGLKGPAWTIAGTAIAGAAKEYLGGGIGGLFGGNNAVMALAAENASLKAEKYADNGLKEQKEDILRHWLKPIADEVADAKVREAALMSQVSSMEKLAEKDKEILEGKMALIQAEAKCCCEKVNARVDSLAGIVNSITAVRIPDSVICTPKTT